MCHAAQQTNMTDGGGEGVGSKYRKRSARLHVVDERRHKNMFHINYELNCQSKSVTNRPLLWFLITALAPISGNVAINQWHKSYFSGFGEKIHFRYFAWCLCNTCPPQPDSFAIQNWELVRCLCVRVFFFQGAVPTDVDKTWLCMQLDRCTNQSEEQMHSDWLYGCQ